MHENGSQPLPLEPFSYVWGNPPSPWHVSIEKSSSFPSSAAIVRYQVFSGIQPGPATHSESIPCYDLAFDLQIPCFCNCGIRAAVGRN